MPEQDANLLELFICQVGKRRNADPVLSKALQRDEQAAQRAAWERYA